VPARFKRQLTHNLARLRRFSASAQPHPEKRERMKAKLAHTPYFVLNYRLRERLRSRKNRKGITKKEQTG